VRLSGGEGFVAVIEEGQAVFQLRDGEQPLHVLGPADEREFELLPARVSNVSTISRMPLVSKKVRPPRSMTTRAQSCGRRASTERTSSTVPRSSSPLGATT
jgi:hypothetical protein